MKSFTVVPHRALIRCAVCFALATAASTGLSQRARGGEDIGIAPVEVGAGPYCFDTAEQHDIRVDVLARGLAHAYSLAFLPDGDALIVERGARLRLLRKATTTRPQLVAMPVAGIPDYAAAERASPDDVLGMQDVAIDPAFSKNHLVYYTFNRPVSFDPATKQWRMATVLARGRLEGLRIVDSRDLLVGETIEDGGGSRIVFGKDHFLYVTVGGLSDSDTESSQRTDNIYGKVLRIKDDGSIPDDNPFVKVRGARKEIYSLGLRDPLGVTVDPRSGSIIASENGPQGGDKIDRIVPGGNYGWPEYTYGTKDEGSPLPREPLGPHTEAPLVVWMPSVAPMGIAFYDGNRFPAWKDNLFVASVRRGEIDHTGALLRVVFNDKLQELREESLLDSLHQRIRDVRQGPDGLLYVLTDEDNSVLLRISPVAASKSCGPG